MLNLSTGANTSTNNENVQTNFFYNIFHEVDQQNNKIPEKKTIFAQLLKNNLCIKILPGKTKLLGTSIK